MSKERLQWLDAAKGVGIILMLIGHSSFPEGVRNFIFSFHMPLFFIASGLTTNFTKPSLVEFIKRKTISLGLPFVVYSFIVYYLLEPFYFIGGGGFWKQAGNR